MYLTASVAVVFVVDCFFSLTAHYACWEEGGMRACLLHRRYLHLYVRTDLILTLLAEPAVAVRAVDVQLDFFGGDSQNSGAATGQGAHRIHQLFH